MAAKKQSSLRDDLTKSHFETKIVCGRNNCKHGKGTKLDLTQSKCQ